MRTRSGVPGKGSHLPEVDPEQATEDANSEAALLQETPDDMTEDSLRQFIDELN